jgi:hypothetical protein
LTAALRFHRQDGRSFDSSSLDYCGHLDGRAADAERGKLTANGVRVCQFFDFLPTTVFFVFPVRSFFAKKKGEAGFRKPPPLEKGAYLEHSDFEHPCAPAEPLVIISSFRGR